MITQSDVRRLFEYREDGVLIRRISTGPTARKGAVAGSSTHSRYQNIRLDGSIHKTHRLIFLYHHGHLPDMIDHIDRNPMNNRIENLRETDHSLNTLNSDRPGGW